MLHAARAALAAGANTGAGRLVWGKLLAREGWLTFHLGRQREALAALSAEIAEIRAAWRWAIAQRAHELIGRAATPPQDVNENTPAETAEFIEAVLRGDRLL